MRRRKRNKESWRSRKQNNRVRELYCNNSAWKPLVRTLNNSLKLSMLFLKMCYSSFSSVQFSSVAQSCSILCDPINCSRPGLLSITNSWSLPKLMSIESVMPSNHLILCRPLLLLPSIFPNIRVFSNESALCIRWPKYWTFQLQHQTFQWTSRTDLL